MSRDDKLLGPFSRRLSSRLLLLLALLTLPLQWWVESPGRFMFDDWLGFHAGFGFLSAGLLVLLASLVGVIVKRRRDYYDDSGGLE